MKTSPQHKAKRSGREEREHQVLMALIDRYIETGKPVGSNTLKEDSFRSLSSATIRNYFVELEKKGLLHQQHASGGRVPTDKAFRYYAEEIVDTVKVTAYEEGLLAELAGAESREIAKYLQEATEALSTIVNCAVFISAPRFDHDYISEIRIMSLDVTRCLCVLITDFGVVRTEILKIDSKLTAFSVKRVEEYFRWRITGIDAPLNLKAEEEELAQRLYNELLIRYVIGYSTFADEEIYRTGFSKLLAYPEFREATALANSLALLENKHTIKLLLKETSSTDSLKFWISDDLKHLTQMNPCCTVVGIPYYINNVPVGAVGIMGSVRMSYKDNFALLKAFSQVISRTLTRNIYKFKISYRQASPETQPLLHEEEKLLVEVQPKLLEHRI